MSESVQVQTIDGGTALAATHTGWQRAARLALEVLRDQSWFIALAIAWIAVGIGIGHAYGETIYLGLYSNLSWQVCFWFGFVFLVGRIVWKLNEHRPEHPIRFVWDDIRGNVFTPRRILSALPPFFLLPAVFSIVMWIKRIIPAIHPYDWDASFAEIDKWSHGGFYPWELLQPILGNPWITVAIAEVYSFPWYIMLLLMQFWYTFSFDPRRQQFLVSYLLIWIILGNGLAVAFASVGPCFYGRFVEGPNPFDAQMAYLAGIAESRRLISALGQDYLWTAYQTNFVGIGNGISAMPSMHVAMGTLMVLWLWNRGKILRTAGIVYLAALQIGSVHLAWHYAIDGYVSIAGTLFIWWVVGRMLNQSTRNNLATMTE